MLTATEVRVPGSLMNEEMPWFPKSSLEYGATRTLAFACSLQSPSSLDVISNPIVRVA